MKIVIGNELFENAILEFQERDGEYTLTFENDTLSHVASACESGQNIEIYENDELVGRWYILELMSIELKRDGGIVARFKASTISQAREQKIMDDIASTEDVLLEVAGLVSEISTTQEDLEEFLNQYKGRVENTIQAFDAAANGFNERFNEQNKNLQNTQSLLNQIQDALTAVQDAIALVPQNVNERFAELDNRYNALADRVAILENGGQ